MFNSAILDVAIGLIFIYLLLSLMCSAANEIIELALKKRAIDLERGIRELLAPGSKSGTPDVVQKLYNHPLVNSLFGGKYDESRIKNTIRRKIMRTGLPSYIPARTFALALMDLVLPGETAPPAAAGPAGAAAPKVTASGAAGATPPTANFEVKLDAPPPPPPAIADPANPLTPLRKAIGASPLLTQHAKDALTPLIDAAVSDVAKARENIEGWFNTSMDRVSSWYKRRTQVVILILGLFVAIAVNADSITLVKRLSTDRALRESLVSAAEKHAQAHATARPSPATSPEKEAGTPESLQSPASPAKSSPAAGSSKSTSEGTSRAASESTSGSKATAPAKASPTPPQACVDDKESEECKFEEKLLKIQACREDRNSPECRYKENLLKIQGLGLPIGWDVQDDLKRKWPGWSWKRPGGWWDQIYWHGLGWLLTAFAISLGAPFWFDLLNKFIVIRSAVKPHEKSPEEESKD